MHLFFMPPSPLSFLSYQASHLEGNGEWMLDDMGHYARAQYDKHYDNTVLIEQM